MVMKNLTIAQNQNTLCYVTIRGGGYQPWIHTLKLGDNVYLQQTTPIILDVTLRCVILYVQNVLVF
jgi:hypothetical protein